MAALWAWFLANWMQVILALLAVDKVLIGIFPSVALFGSLGSMLQGLIGSGPASLKK